MPQVIELTGDIAEFVIHSKHKCTTAYVRWFARKGLRTTVRVLWRVHPVVCPVTLLFLHVLPPPGANFGPLIKDTIAIKNTQGDLNS